MREQPPAPVTPTEPTRPTLHKSRTFGDIEEIVARDVAADTRRDVRTVRREMRAPGSVRGLVGAEIRVALARHRRVEAFKAEATFR